MPKRYCAIADGFFAIKNNPVAPDEITVSTAVENHGTLRETGRAARNAVWRRSEANLAMVNFPLLPQRKVRCSNRCARAPSVRPGSLAIDAYLPLVSR